MEQHAAPLLMPELKIKSTFQMKEIIRKSLDLSIPKYMSILKNYFGLLDKFNKINEFKSNLIAMMSHNIEDLSQTNSQANYKVQKTVRKQFVGLLVITYCDIYDKVEVNSFYDLWNIIFPNHKQTKMRLSKYDIQTIKNAKSTIDNTKISQENEHSSNSYQESEQNHTRTLTQLQSLSPSPAVAIPSEKNISTNTINLDLCQIQNGQECNNKITLQKEKCLEIQTQKFISFQLLQEQNNDYLTASNKNAQQLSNPFLNRDIQNQMQVSHNESQMKLEEKIQTSKNLIAQSPVHQQNQKRQNIQNPPQLRQQETYPIHNQNMSYISANQSYKGFETNQINQFQERTAYNCINFKEETIIQNQYLDYQQLQENSNIDRSALVINAQNLKQLGCYYQIEPEFQNQLEGQQVPPVFDQPNSLSVNVNSDADLFTSFSGFDDDEEDYQNFYNTQNAQIDYTEYHQQTNQVHDNTFQSPLKNNFIPFKNYEQSRIQDYQRGEVFHCHQGMSEYPMNDLAYPQQPTPSNPPFEQVDNFSNYYFIPQNTEILNTQEEFIDSLFNHNKYL